MADMDIFQANTNASLKNLETQVGQLAFSLQKQSKDTFPSDTQKNPKDCLVVTLRSGKEHQESKRKKEEAKLPSLDLEIERTLTRLRKLKTTEQEGMAEQEDMRDSTQEATPNRLNARQRTMKDLWRPVIREDYSAVGALVVDANNFELKPALITLVRQNHFTGHPYEDPNVHMGRFLRMTNKVKMNGVRSDVIKLQLFPFSLRDITITWFESLPYGSVNTWEEIVEAFMERFFPTSPYI